MQAAFELCSTGKSAQIEPSGEPISAPDFRAAAQTEQARLGKQKGRRENKEATSVTNEVLRIDERQTTVESLGGTINNESRRRKLFYFVVCTWLFVAWPSSLLFHFFSPRSRCLAASPERQVGAALSGAVAAAAVVVDVGQTSGKCSQQCLHCATTHKLKSK